METFTGIFMYCSPVKKKHETQHIGLKFDFFFNLFSWRNSTMNNLQYFLPFISHKLCLEVCLSANKGNYLSIRRWVIISKNVKVAAKLFSAEVDQTFLKVHAKNLVKVTGTGGVKGRKRPPTLRKLSFKFRY